MASGMEMMLKSLGVDPKKIIQDFEALRTGVTKTLAELNERLTAIEKTEAELLAGQREIILWMNQQPPQQQTPPQPQQVPPPPPNPLPLSPPLTLVPQPPPPNPPPQQRNA
jgi:hypothetical protein